MHYFVTLSNANDPKDKPTFMLRSHHEIEQLRAAIKGTSWSVSFEEFEFERVEDILDEIGL